MRSARLFATLALPFVLSAGGASVGCFDGSCDDQESRTQPGSGRLVDADTWESGPIDGEWLRYDHRMLIAFDTSLLGTRLPDSVLVYISADKRPLQGGSFTIAGGNVADITIGGPGAVYVKNNSCAEYYIRLVVHAPPQAPDAGATDAGSGDAGDASAGDASDGGPSDAGAD
ncbi:MAG: hypothetical protein HOO96_27580 [Polyangiaceae bacterium]|nr:hypothetical protein [Polyangiaceae bacterium]